jgi:hypothetical protein
MKTLSVLLFAAGAYAQGGGPGIGHILENQMGNAESEIVSLVQAMPEAKFGFAPKDGQFKGVRTFSEQAKHIAAVLYMVSAAAKGEKPPVDLGAGENGPDSVKSKDDVVQFMKGAFAYARGAAASMTAERFEQQVKAPWGEGTMARGALVSLGTWHSFDHYGQMVVYARMNGVIPPASQPQPAK